MEYRWLRFAGCAAVIFMAATTSLAQTTTEIRNSKYVLQLKSDGSVDVTTHGHTITLQPRFSVVNADSDPGLNLVKDKETAFKVPTWKLPHAKGVTSDFFKAGDILALVATSAKMRGNTVEWTFAPQQRFQLHAELTLPPGSVDPTIQLAFKALTAGWYSVGFTGSPQIQQSDVKWLWQPLVWQEQRFPGQSFLSIESMCSLPATFVQTSEYTVGLAVDPSEVPFRLPTLKNSRFGVVLRNQEGNAQPMAFAPAFGSDSSHLTAGATVDFRMRAFVEDGDWYASYKHIAQDIFGFHDYRHNGPASLNTTLDNMVDFAMNDIYSGWRADLKAFDYTTDVAGTVKLVSSLHPLSVAILRDSPEIYRLRALPMMEYLMSRQKYLFSEAEDINGQNASHLLKGPAAEVSELSALYLMSQNRTPVFSHYAHVESETPRRLNLNMVSSGNTFQDMLALYRMSGDPQYLARAKTKADVYLADRINRKQRDFADVHVDTGGQFWTDFSPKWRDLLELYETTQDKRYLDAAAEGAREYTQYVWLQPTVPDTDVLVNPGGLTPQNYTGKLPDPKPIPSPEQMVPAWRVSQVGLTPEASTTYASAPGIFLTHYAAYMLRLSAYTGDPFFRDIARSAVVGRYENFPGYDTFGAYTTTYQRPDYPLRPWTQLTYNQIYYNHVWPNIALLYDYLISDAVVRGAGKISFPARYAPSYAYLQSKVYGDRPGKIYGDAAVQLWMPRGLAQIDQTEINYVAGYGKNSLYLILMNQAHGSIQTKIRLDPNVVPYAANHHYKVRVWLDNRTEAATELIEGQVTVPVSDKGLTVIAIDDIKITPVFQSDYLSKDAKPLTDQSYTTVNSPFGPVHGMILSMGKRLDSAYVWLEATEKDLKEVRFSYRKNDRWEMVTDQHYPYEFSLPVGDNDSEFVLRVEGVRPDGSVVRTGDIDLRR